MIRQILHTNITISLIHLHKLLSSVSLVTLHAYHLSIGPLLLYTNAFLHDRISRIRLSFWHIKITANDTLSSVSCGEISFPVFKTFADYIN